jgi:hypothetical protein
MSTHVGCIEPYAVFSLSMKRAALAKIVARKAQSDAKRNIAEKTFDPGVMAGLHRKERK